MPGEKYYRQINFRKGDCLNSNFDVVTANGEQQTYHF